MTNRTTRIACFGEALIDFLAKPAHDASEPRAFHQFAGGAPANVAVAVARLGGDAQFVGMFGQDMFGDFLLDSLQRLGVGTVQTARTDAANTALAFVALDDDGERHFNFYRPPAADLLFRREHFDDACFDGLASFHVCSNSLTESAIADTTVYGMQRARAAGAVVSCDLNWRPALWDRHTDPHPRLWAALHEADLIKLARSELEFLAHGLRGEAAQADDDDLRLVLDRAWQGHAQIVIVTDGDAPVRWFTRTQRGDVASYAVRAIDTTAAGDAFVGGLLYALADRAVDRGGLADFLRDEDALAHALRFAAAVGALAVTRHGAFAAMPDLAEVQSLIGGKGGHR
ncbi:MAG: carbohydrate kinase [Rudaea sp.]|uniref:carbohydrate kinase family protein n=1 Tax=unclassified Rudaea TaxID=2627037 RepID=UPI0010F748B2|nr:MULTISPECIES: carbohydrate kinase [unclassified Rudaea]MBN8887486.1 carbohydrate kinase [Rudaea sp.]